MKSLSEMSLFEVSSSPRLDSYLWSLNVVWVSGNYKSTVFYKDEVYTSFVDAGADTFLSSCLLKIMSFDSTCGVHGDLVGFRALKRFKRVAVFSVLKDNFINF